MAAIKHTTTMTTNTTTFTYEYDDCGVLCRYNDRLEGWEVLEPHCLNCGYGEDDHRDDECDWKDAPYTKDDTPASQRKWYKGEEKDKEPEPYTPHFKADTLLPNPLLTPPTSPKAKPKPKKTIVKGMIHTEVIWKVPAEIDLDDTETYEYYDRWGTLYINNLKTGERVAEIEIDHEECDRKFCDDLEHLTDDDEE